MSERHPIVQLPDGNLECMECENQYMPTAKDRQIIGGMTAVDSVQSEPEEWPADDPMMPKWGVTVFFQHRDEAESFIRAVKEA